MQLKIICAIAFGTLAAADKYTLAALNNIQQATVDFNTALANWNGGVASALPILQKSYDLKRTLDAAASARAIIKSASADCSPEVEQESLAIGQSLAITVGVAVDTAISIKPKMEGIPILGKPIVLAIFQGLHTSASALGVVISPKASEGHQETVRSISNQIDEHFARGIAAYQ